MDQRAFKDLVKQYIDLHDKIAEGRKMLSLLRKKKVAIEPEILDYMKNNDIDECCLADGTLARRVSKTTSTLKKEYIRDELTKVFGNAAQAEEVMTKMLSNRSVTQKEVLRRHRKRQSSKPDSDDDDDDDNDEQ